MTDRKRNTLVTEGGGLYSVIAVSFEDDRNAYNALTVLKELDSQRRLGVQEAVVAVRGEDATESALGGISSTVTVGRTALLAVVAEQSPEVIDAAMSGMGGTVLRRSVDDVEVEIAAAEDAERTAKWEARKELLRARHQRDKAAMGAKVGELKAKLHPDDSTGTSPR